MKTINWSDAPHEDVLPGIVRQILDGDRQTLVRYVYQPGAVFPEHQHPQEQITVVLSGEIEFTVDGKVLVLRAGEAAVIPANVAHGARVTGTEVVATLNTLSPRRDDHPAPKASQRS